MNKRLLVVVAVVAVVAMVAVALGVIVSTAFASNDAPSSLRIGQARLVAT